MEDLTLSIKRASEITSLSLRTIERMAASGEVRSLKIGRRRLVYADSLRDFLKAKAA
ncbi:excisionase family DNA binding protein [Sphingopyxis italica]|uniref:Excisionase family DNA binding protein n=1 Tax=Sphingopyxis italica TaxID=1129133 RepID=A0A7X6B986_9SPHN|nr:excisionase family DNA-binding protein [Sphingopyxis italica]NJB90560.1 excisionase family DNA binding protein [Sphingopyxis italica]